MDGWDAGCARSRASLWVRLTGCRMCARALLAIAIGFYDDAVSVAMGLGLGRV